MRHVLRRHVVSNECHSLGVGDGGHSRARRVMHEWCTSDARVMHEWCTSAVMLQALRVARTQSRVSYPDVISFWCLGRFCNKDDWIRCKRYSIIHLQNCKEQSCVKDRISCVCFRCCGILRYWEKVTYWKNVVMSDSQIRIYSKTNLGASLWRLTEPCWVHLCGASPSLVGCILALLIHPNIAIASWEVKWSAWWDMAAHVCCCTRSCITCYFP